MAVSIATALRAARMAFPVHPEHTLQIGAVYVVTHEGNLHYAVYLGGKCFRLTFTGDSVLLSRGRIHSRTTARLRAQILQKVAAC